MNLKKTVFSLFAATAMTLTMVAPIAANSTGHSVNVNAQVTEGGSFKIEFWKPVAFSGNTDVTTTQGTTLISEGNTLAVTETRASSPGWSLQIEATDFTTEGGYAIWNDELSVNASWNQFVNSCFRANTGFPLTGNPTNPLQIVTLQNTSFSLANPVNLVSASSGGGCGSMRVMLDYSLNVPNRTYTGGSEAVYTSQIKVTNMNEVGN